MGYSIAVAQQFSGHAKSTILLHLAHAWAHNGSKVEILEFAANETIKKRNNLAQGLTLNHKLSQEWVAGAQIHESMEHHDITLVDLPRTTPQLQHTIVETCDLVLIPCQPLMIQVKSSLKILSLCKQHNTAARVVLFGIPAPKRMVLEMFQVFKKVHAIPLRSALGDSVTNTTGMLDAFTKHGGKTAQDEVDKLREEVDLLIISLQTAQQ